MRGVCVWGGGVHTNLRGGGIGWGRFLSILTGPCVEGGGTTLEL